MAATRQPLLAIHVVWHPASDHHQIAGALRTHFNRERIVGVGDRMGVSTVFRSEPATGSVPADVEFDRTETTAVVLLAGDEMVDDAHWREYIEAMVANAAADPLRRRILPAAITQAGLGAAPGLQALRWYDWARDDTDPRPRLVFELTHELALMLNAYRSHLRDPDADREPSAAPQPVRVFLSHSKHDDTGERVAKHVRDWLHGNSRLSSFFDVVDITPGLSFTEVLAAEVEGAAVLVVHSDSYSSRAWCQREVLLAKEKCVPLVVASCLNRGDERSFPYLGNVPVVPLLAERPDSTRAVIGRLLDEVLRWALWQCRTVPLREQATGVLFIPRPPELLTFAQLKRQDALLSSVVYAGPRIGVHEEELLAGVGLPAQSFDEWLVEEGA